MSAFDFKLLRGCYHAELDEHSTLITADPLFRDFSVANAEHCKRRPSDYLAFCYRMAAKSARCLDLAVRSNDPIEGLPKCLAPHNGRGNLWSMDNAIFRPQFLNQLVASLVHHFREVASSNGLVRCNVHGSRPFVGPTIIRNTNRRDTHLSAIGSKMGMHHVHRECPLLALSGHYVAFDVASGG